MARFIIKQQQMFIPTKHRTKRDKYVKVENKDNKNNTTMCETVMTTQEKVEAAKAVLGATRPAKRMKADKGLIERTESSRTVLTEDNKELLID